MLSKSIKVLYPVLHYPPVIGGLEQWEQNIAERQPDDVIITVVTGKVKDAPCYEKMGNIEILRTSFFTLKDISHSPMIYIATAVPPIVFRSLVLALKNKVDIFHCHGFVSAIMGYVLSFLTGKPFIGTEQSIIGQNTFKKLVCGMIYRKAAVCVAASRAVAGEFKKIGVRKIEIIPNGVDLEKFTARDRCAKCGTSDVPHKEFVILSVGRLEKVKGHKYLVDAFAGIINLAGSDPAFGGVRPRLIIVGDGSERNHLEARVRELGVESAVEFVGEIPHNELPHWYHKVDVFVMPSLSEGFGITVIEAMAAGLPVVASCVGGLKDIIEDGKTGLMVQVANSGEIAAAVCRLWKDRALKERIRSEARTCVQKYDWNNISTRVHSIYERLVN